VKNQPEVTLYSNGDSLADSPQFAHYAALDIANGRLCGSKQKKTGQPNTLDWLRDDARLECADVGGDIR